MLQCEKSGFSVDVEAPGVYDEFVDGKSHRNILVGLKYFDTTRSRQTMPPYV